MLWCFSPCETCADFFFLCYGDPRDLHVLTHSFPTRRSSDLFRQHFLKVAIADRIATIPAHRPQDHITLEMAPLEIRHRSVRPISAKHAQASRFLQQSPHKDGYRHWAMPRWRSHRGVAPLAHRRNENAPVWRNARTNSEIGRAS